MKSKKLKFADIKGMLHEDEMKEISGGSGSYSYGSADPSSYMSSGGGGADPIGMASIDASQLSIFGSVSTAGSTCDMVMAMCNATPSGSTFSIVDNGDGTFTEAITATDDQGVVHDLPLVSVTSATGGDVIDSYSSGYYQMKDVVYGSTASLSLLNSLTESVNEVDSLVSSKLANWAIWAMDQGVGAYANSTDNLMGINTTQIGNITSYVNSHCGNSIEVITQYVNNGPGGNSNITYNFYDATTQQVLGVVRF